MNQLLHKHHRERFPGPTLDLIPPRLRLGPMMALAAILVSATATPARANEGTDDLSVQRARALLQGVLAQRLSYDVIDAEIEVVSMHPVSKEVMSKLHYRTQQSGSRRRCEQLADSLEPSVYITDQDADTVHGFIRAPNASLDIYSNEYAESRRGIKDFDPRVLGMTSSMSHSSTVERCLLMHEQNTSIELLQPVEDAGSVIERVKISKGGYSSEYWISEPKFQLRRRIVTWSPDTTATVLSEYDPNIANGDLPVTVTIQDRQQGNNADRVVKLLKVNVSDPIPGDAFTISSIGLPVNTMFNDYRTNRIVGYWNGHEMSPRPITDGDSPLAVNIAAAKPKTSRTWILLANVGLLGCIVASLLYNNRRQKRSGEA